MAPGRLIACCLGVAVTAILILGCGSSDATSANIDPAIASDFTNKLEVIRGYAADGDCEGATDALATLKKAVDIESGQTGEQFTADLQELLDKLNAQIVDQCQPADETSTTSTTESTESAPIVTDPPTETSTSSTTKETSTTEETTNITPPPTTPPTPPGGGGGPPDNPGGGIIPGGGKRIGAGHGRQIKKPKPDKHEGNGTKKKDEKGHGR